MICVSLMVQKKMSDGRALSSVLDIDYELE